MWQLCPSISCQLFAVSLSLCVLQVPFRNCCVAEAHAALTAVQWQLGQDSKAEELQLFIILSINNVATAVLQRLMQRWQLSSGNWGKLARQKSYNCVSLFLSLVWQLLCCRGSCSADSCSVATRTSQQGRRALCNCNSHWFQVEKGVIHTDTDAVAAQAVCCYGEVPQHCAWLMNLNLFDIMSSSALCLADDPELF